ncbi:DUF1877 family protein [Chitinophaga sp. S165]|uniref:DUF1877 family protein n=1 Tax=Chitinophaga sp. S165 TaxID=2135462 RepID=UPI000D7193D8
MVLSKITNEELAEKYDAARMIKLGIYPDIWQDQEALYYFLAYFMEIQTFYSTAAENNEAIITGII